MRITAKKQAELHWEYIKVLLLIHEPSNKTLAVYEYLYTQAFIHGYKHGKEER